MPKMARGKRRNEMSAEQAREVVASLTVIRELLGSDNAVAKKLNVSRAAWKKWQDQRSTPTTANLEVIRRVLHELQRRAPDATKVTTRDPAVLDDAAHATLASAPFADGGPSVVKGEFAKMGALLAAVSEGDEPTYLLELEICLWYHRDDVAAGDISQTAIAAAREGIFEVDGCETWSAKRWWLALREYDLKVRPSLRRLRPKPASSKN